MREAIAIAACLVLVFLGLQTGLLRTGLDYDQVQKRNESLQAANERLSEALKQASPAAAAPGEAQEQLEALKAELNHFRALEAGGRAQVQEQKAKWLKVFDQEIKDGLCEIKEEDGALAFVMRDKALFQGDAVGLNRPAQALLSKIAQEIRELKDMEIRVMAYTDFTVEGKNFTEKNAQARALASTRALAISYYLDTPGGVDPVQIVSGSYGANRPLVANDSEYHRAQNRRFEIWLEPVNPRKLNLARKIVHFERQFKAAPIAPKASKPAKVKNDEEDAQPIGAESLDSEDSNTFDAGYEKPQH